MKIHIVQKGDTLWEIAKQYGVDFEEVKQLNSHLSSPDMIMPGMKIRIPTTAKTVKKEMPTKEAQKPAVKQPYKDISPKPLPVIKEDDVKPIKEVKQEMPMPQMPQMPLQPMMQMPMMSQEFQQDLTINFPKMPTPKEKPKKIKEKPKEEPMQQPVQQPVHQPLPQQPVHMVPCFPVVHHPCCPPFHPCHPHELMHFQPMYHPGVLGTQFDDFESSMMEMPMQQMPAQQMPMQQMPTGDCGCNGSNAAPTQQMGYMQPPFGYDQFQQPSQTQPMPPFGNQPTQYPPMTGFNQTAYPTPPGFPSFRPQEEDESSSE
ncbi:SafA/ExsA family spore coat assembly protein [Ornithinibacillus salinisoli]|uniref:SafA/ExsA family spore coat assembly protein n=1 Tax=Ornithinibacillus salinisoli TaxID=1848459 RepID=A0ABW4W3T8_9BACI